jgi:hypothetical protein
VAHFNEENQAEARKLDSNQAEISGILEEVLQ